MIGIINDLDGIAAQMWDAIVVGAGPSGCVAARAIAQQGHRVLIVEAKQFPREKVCGGCLSARGVALLERHGLLEAVRECGPVAIDRVDFVMPHGHHSLAVPSGLSVSRRALDSVLLREAVASGAQSLLGVRATVCEASVDSCREVILARQGCESVKVGAKLVIAADGLGHPSLARLGRFTSRVCRSSRIGIGAVAEVSKAAIPKNCITMIVHRHGYVGLSHCEGGRLSIAAALDAALLADCKSPGAAIDRLLAPHALPFAIDTDSIYWTGTRPLTQLSGDVADARLFVVGDAASYVEPLTGEGMASGLAAGTAVAPIAIAAIQEWSDRLATEWRDWNRQDQRRRHRACRVITQAARTPWVVDLGLRMVCAISPLGRAVARHLHGPTGS